MKIFITIIFFIFGIFCVKDIPYQQVVPHIYRYKDLTPLADWGTLPIGSSKDPITQVAMGPKSGHACFLTSSTLSCATVMSNGKFMWGSSPIPGLKVTPGMRMRRSQYVAAEFSVAGPAGLWRCPSSGCFFISTTALGNVTDMIITKDQDLWIGSSNGLFFHPFDSQAPPTRIQPISSPSIISVGFDEKSQSPFASGSDGLVWRLLNSNYWHYYRTPGIIDGNPTIFLGDDSGNTWMGNDVCINILAANQTFNRIGGLEGLIMSNITSGALLNGRSAVWFGTMYGAMRYDQTKGPGSADTRRYFYGSRYLPGKDTSEGQNVSSIAILDRSDETVIIVTEKGLSVLIFESWTLEKKAQVLQDMIFPRHDRYGLVFDCDLASFGNVSSCGFTTSDNSGLWTSIYVAAQAFRYAVTKDPKAKQAGWRAFEGMELLNNATGIKGYPARDVVKQPNSPGNNWYPSPTMSGWWFKGDTSSDEIVGHLFAYPLVYYLLAETPNEKARAYKLIDDITGGIVDNNWYLIGEKGTHTTWGVWNPSYLNDNYWWYDERGVNANQILAWLLSAYKITNNSKYLNGYYSLVNQYGYSYNIINLKITQPSDDNYSDDELTFLPYYTWILSGLPYGLDNFRLSMERTWRITFPEKPSLWNFIAGSAGFPNFGLEESIWNLQSWPVSQINWPVQNGNRLDIRFRTNMARNNDTDPRSVDVLRYDEISFFRWNSNPFECNDGSGYSESDPSAYLLPYWMGRYYKFIE